MTEQEFFTIITKGRYIKNESFVYNDNFYDFVYGGVYYSFKITQKEKVFMKEKLFNNIFLAEDIFFKIENDELSLLDFDQFWREL